MGSYSAEPIPQLYVNDGPLDPHNVALLRPSHLDEPLEVLRSRLMEDGYLFVKQLLPRADVLKAREAYFSYLSPTGVLKPGTAPVEGIFDLSKDTAGYPGIGAGSTGQNGRPGGDAAQQFVDLAIQAHKEPWYAEDFCKHPVLRDFVSRLTGWGDKTLMYRRSLLRNNIPGTHAIGVHYDQIFLRYGDLDSLTAWCPMGDISIEGGGLIYLEDSTGLGEKFENEFAEKAKAAGLSEEEARSAFNSNMLSNGLLTDGPAGFGKEHGKRWLVSSYEAGDVVLHLPFMIHASTVNHDPKGTIRLATDLRFCDSTKPYDKRWCNYFEVGDGV
ncbi:hypothetical protein VTK73DRAFT_578 [Phialemonium thermophilum]|uniref:Phytanoyl-CoA hydroxylase n=1 Tax=Phialemonium thermophilum TaxID=223376 RepID=A0ABR3XEG7_9PEZI